MMDQPPVEIEAPWIVSDIRVSDVDDTRWNYATPIAITRRWSGEEAPPERHAEARILWTAQAVYVRFVCRQHEPLIVSARPLLDEKTVGLWNRDVCEIFLAPNADDPGRYFEFEAAPTGEWVDLAISFKGTTRETDSKFHSGMTVFARVVDEHLTVAMRIPWTETIPIPEKGEHWRVNLFRCVGVGNDRYLAWQPSYTEEPNFHVPEAFGWLKFV